MSAADKTKLDSLTPGGSTLVTDVRAFPGADLSIKLQAANDFWGDTPAYLFVSAAADADNHFSQRVIFNANKHVHLSVGYYDTSAVTATGLFVFRDNFTLTGDGWATNIQQINNLVVVAPYTNLIVSGDYPGGDNITVRDFQISRAANPITSGGGESAVFIGNCNHCTVANILFDHCRGIDVNLGANSNLVSGVSYHGSDINVYGNVHRYLDDDVIKCSVVNAFNWTIQDCIFENGACIDIEPNAATDLTNGFAIADCVFSGGGSIFVQGLGSNDGTITDCTFSSRGIGNGAIQLHQCANVRVEDNVVDGYNGNDAILSYGIVAISTIDCQIVNNTILNCSNVSTTPNPFNSKPLGCSQSSVRTLIKGNYVASPRHGWSGAGDDASCVGTIVEDNVFGLGSGSQANGKTDSLTDVSIQVVAPSIGQSLPQATINVVSTFLFSASGTLTINTDAGVQTVTYTGKTATSFTGCSGGTGMMFTGAMPDITVLGQGSYQRNNRVWLDSGESYIELGGAAFRTHRVVSGTSNAFAITDEIVGADTSTGAVAIKLPDPATAYWSLNPCTWEVTIQDEANNAAVNNITIQRFGSEKINGVAADKVVSTNSGALIFYTNGTDWFAR